MATENAVIEIKINWQGMVLPLIALIQGGQMDLARQEMAKMALAADNWVEYVKSTEEEVA